MLNKDVLKEINKKHETSSGRPIAVPLSDLPKDFSYTPTGLLTFDWAIGRPGIPKGRIVEIYGPNQSGKTAVALLVAKSVQERGGDVMFVDAEHSANMSWFKDLDDSNLIYVDPEVGEQALDVLEDAIRGGVDLIIVDSVATLLPRAEYEASFEEKQRAELARMMNKATRNFAPAVAHSESIIIFINQTRSNMTMYGNPEVTPGGSAMSFAASLRVRVQKFEDIKDGKDIVGQRSKLKVVKNKIKAPGRESTFDLLYYGSSSGIDKTAAILDAAELAGIIVKRGSHIYLVADDIKVGSSRADALNNLNNDSILRSRLQDEVWSTLT